MLTRQNLDWDEITYTRMTISCRLVTFLGIVYVHVAHVLSMLAPRVLCVFVMRCPVVVFIKGTVVYIN